MKEFRLSIPVDSPCCGYGMMAWAYYPEDYKIYMCRNCANVVPRKKAIPLVRKARNRAKAIIKEFGLAK